MKAKAKITPYLYIAPFFLGFIIFSLYPTIYALWLSFFRWDGISPKIFVGLGNYTSAILNPFFQHSILVSLLYILTGPITTLVGLVLAAVLNSKLIVGANFYKLAYFIPYITMPVAIAVLFSILLGWNYGTINQALLAVGLIKHPINWLGESQFVFFCITLVVVWRYFGYHLIIYLSGMQSIDIQLYEAAKIDGATSVKSFLHITLPSLKPYIVFLMLTSISGGINLFDEPMMLYGPSGGAGGAAQNAGMFIYQTTFINNNWGYGSSASFIMFCIICVLSILFYKINYRNSMEGDQKA
jgi:cellobiose transport system permease protein